MKILIVDDHPVTRAGLRALLDAIADGQTFEAENGKAALASLERHRPDLVLLDLMLPDIRGLDLLRQMLSVDQMAKVVVLSMQAEPWVVARVMEVGAFGYLSKNASADEVLAALQHAARGVRYIEREIAQKLALQSLPPNRAFVPLTTCETSALRLLAEGVTLAEIAAQLSISRREAARLRSNVLAKLGMTKVADLMRCATWFDPI